MAYYHLKFLLDGSSKAMNVNGSSVNKVYSYSPGEDNSCLIAKLIVLMKDAGTTSYDKFGAITALTNGILIKQTVGAVDREYHVLKDNIDLQCAFPNNTSGNSATDTLGAPIGFGDSADVFFGFVMFEITNKNLYQYLSGSDSISVTIRDNLTNIDFLSMAVLLISE